MASAVCARHCTIYPAVIHVVAACHTIQLPSVYRHHNTHLARSELQPRLHWRGVAVEPTASRTTPPTDTACAFKADEVGGRGVRV